MKIKNLLIVFGILAITSCVVSKKKYDAVQAENAKLKKEMEASKNPTIDMSNEVSKVSYSLGVNMGSSLKNQGLESIDSTAIAVALGEVFSGKPTKMTVQETQQYLQGYFGEIQNKRIEKQSAEGAKFLADNSMKPGVKTLPSGLQYKVIKAGTGAIPKASDKVKTHYTGMLINGKIFDSSVQRGQPATFGVTGVIKGWQEALQLMPVGSKWELYIPHFLAYGERGNQSIPPYAALVFEIELLEIVKAKKEKPLLIDQGK